MWAFFTHSALHELFSHLITQLNYLFCLKRKIVTIATIIIIEVRGCASGCEVLDYHFYSTDQQQIICSIAQISHSLITFITACTGYIYEAFDGTLRMNVALKMEKKDKSKNILKFEY